MRELMAIERGLKEFAPFLYSHSVAVFSDNTTALAYLRNQGGTHSCPLNLLAKQILIWTEQFDVLLRPQFVMGRKNVIADSLSRSQ